MKGGASTFDIMRDVCARAPARRGAQQSCAGRVGVAGAVEEHVEGVLEWGVVAAAELVVVGGVLASACGEVRISDQAGPEPSAEIDGIGAIQEGLSEGAIKLEFCPFDWEPPVTRELADMPKGVVRLALPEGDVPVPGGFWLLPTSNQPLLKTTAWSLSCR